MLLGASVSKHAAPYKLTVINATNNNKNIIRVNNNIIINKLFYHKFH